MKKTRMIAFAAICLCLILCCGLALAGGKNTADKNGAETKGAKVYITSALYGPTNLKAQVNGTKVRFSWNAESVGIPDGYAIFLTDHRSSVPSSMPYGFYWNGPDGYKWVPKKLLKTTTSTSCTIDLKKKGTYYIIAISYSGSPKSTISSHSAGVVVKVTASSAEKPTVTTGKAGSITGDSAKASFTVGKNGGQKITDAGIQYGYSKTNLSRKSYGALGNEKGTFSVKLTGLKSGKKVYYRAYAKNSAGVAYGSWKTFTTTKAAEKPTVETLKATEIGTSSAKLGINLTRNGGANVTDCGIRWGYSENKLNNKVSFGKKDKKTGKVYKTVKDFKANSVIYYQAYAVNKKGTSYGKTLSFTLKEAVSSTKYRALLIGEKTFIRVNQQYQLYLETANRNEGDANNMASMLGRVKGLSGAKYQVTKKINQSYSEIRSLIINTFKDTTDQDVSLFFIASHGNSDGDGELEMPYKGKVDSEIDLMEYLEHDSLPFSKLATWLKQYVKGKVIVILESCGAGSAIYSYDEQNGMKTIIGHQELKGASGDAVSKKIVSKAIQAFSAADPGVVEPNSTGDLRSSKFYVLAASRHHEMSWGYEGWFDSQNYFTKWLIDGVGKAGNSPADTSPKDSYVTLTELFNYISKTGDHYPFTTSDGKTYYQHVQRYPVGSTYKLFRLN